MESKGRMHHSRREFLKQVSAAAAAAGTEAGVVAATDDTPQALPWYRRTCCRGQTNITEADPSRDDIAWWRRYWKRTWRAPVHELIPIGPLAARVRLSQHLQPKIMKRLVKAASVAAQVEKGWASVTVPFVLEVVVWES